MRSRILGVALASVVLAVALFGVPLAFVVQRLIFNDARSELEQSALRAGSEVSPAYRDGDQIELGPVEPGSSVGIYDLTGKRVAGTGPGLLEPGLDKARHGVVAHGSDPAEISVAVPVGSGERTFAVARAATASSEVWHRVWWSWAGMALVAILAAGCGAVLAAWQSRRLARPITALEDVTRELGEGSFVVQLAPSGVPELDRAGAALGRTAERLAALIARERAFSAQASHQLRTPLTQIRLELETSVDAEPDELRAAARGAIDSTDQLSQTIDDMLLLAREDALLSPDGFDAEDLLSDIRGRWNGVLARQDRPLRIVLDDPPRAAASLSAVRQILQVLMDNAYHHGRGAVTIRARESVDALAIDVTDEGRATDIPWADPLQGESARAAGLGLTMARSLAAGQHGRLLLSHDPDGTRFTVLLPTAESLG